MIELFGVSLTIHDMHAAATFFAAGIVTLFIAFYSPRPWRRSSMGVSIMSAAAATALVAYAGVLNRIDRRITEFDLTEERAIVATVAWLALGAAYIHRLYVLRDDDEEEE